MTKIAFTFDPCDEIYYYKRQIALHFMQEISVYGVLNSYKINKTMYCTNKSFRTDSGFEGGNKLGFSSLLGDIYSNREP